MIKKFEGLPLGAGGELEKQKETLPTTEVDNEVIWTNPAFEGQLPFKLEEYKRTNLGLFLSPEGSADSKQVEIHEFHTRSAILGRVIFRDKDGSLYRDVDIKGLGSSESRRQYKGLRYGGVNAVPGILDEASALKDQYFEEKLFEAGVRTPRTLALVRLREILTERSKPVSIGKAKKRNFFSRKKKALPQEINPVLSIRAFGTRMRVEDIWEPENKNRLLYIKDAKELVASELKTEAKDFSDIKYLEWFSLTLGQNIGRMHRNNMAHNNLGTHNVTLDCRIVDFDTVSQLNEKAAEQTIHDNLNRARRSVSLPGYDEDFFRGWQTVKALADEAGGDEESTQLRLQELYEKSYNAELATNLNTNN